MTTNPERRRHGRMWCSFVVGLVLTCVLPAQTHAQGEQARTLLDHEVRRLHSSDTLNLYEHFAGEPLLIVNTASHCGFTRQFEGLEALHQRYRERGLRVLGFSSNDFRQEAADEAEAAEVCFINFGVSFDMFATIPVSGDDAHPVFRELARQAHAPRWNFHKYVVDGAGRVVAAFPSRVEPDADEVTAAIEEVLSQDGVHR